MSLTEAEHILKGYDINPAKIRSEKDLEQFKPSMKTAEFDADDIKILLDNIKTVPVHEDFEVVKDFVKATFYDAGHIK